MSIFGKGILGLGGARVGPGSPPADPHWTRTKRGHYHRLVHLDPEAEGLDDRNGVFVIWHAGVRPAWVFVGRADDLARGLHAIADNRDVMDYEINGGLYVTWAEIDPRYQPGAVAYLTDKLRPLVANPDARPAEHVPLLTPADVARKP